jgi:hypothetical protein
MKNKLIKNGSGCLLVITLLLFNINCTNQYTKSANEKIVRTVYTAYEKKDWNMLTSVFADGFNFTSPYNDHIGIKEYKALCWPNCYNIAKFNIDKLVVDGDNAYVTYTCTTKAGKTLHNIEYFELKDGKIKDFTCYFGPGIGYPNNTAK